MFVFDFVRFPTSDKDHCWQNRLSCNYTSTMSKAAFPSTRKCCEQPHKRGEAHACFSGSLYPTVLKTAEKPQEEEERTSNGIKSCPACGKNYKKSHACKQNCHDVEGLTGIVYLVQPSALWVAKSNIFKIGCSKQLTLSRPRSYGPNPAPHALASVDDPSKVERALIAAFDAEFKCESAVGREYYSGSIIAMKITFGRVVNDCLPLLPALPPTSVSLSSVLPVSSNKESSSSKVQKVAGRKEGETTAVMSKPPGGPAAGGAVEDREEQQQQGDAGFVDWLFVELSSLFTAKMKLEKK